jgi:hypothetical protein
MEKLIWSVSSYSRSVYYDATETGYSLHNFMFLRHHVDTYYLNWYFDTWMYNWWLEFNRRPQKIVTHWSAAGHSCNNSAKLCLGWYANYSHQKYLRLYLCSQNYLISTAWYSLKRFIFYITLCWMHMKLTPKLIKDCNYKKIRNDELFYSYKKQKMKYFFKLNILVHVEKRDVKNLIKMRIICPQSKSNKITINASWINLWVHQVWYMCYS